MAKPETTASNGPPTPSRHAGEPRSASTVVADRKSTRLNSSHLVISYAVFCLKKKNLPVAQALCQVTALTISPSARGTGAALMRGKPLRIGDTIRFGPGAKPLNGGIAGRLTNP